MQHQIEAMSAKVHEKSTWLHKYSPNFLSRFFKNSTPVFETRIELLIESIEISFLIQETYSIDMYEI